MLSVRLAISPSSPRSATALSSAAPEPISGWGTVQLGPLYGRVRIAGLTFEQAEARIREHLARFILGGTQVSVERYPEAADLDLQERVARVRVADKLAEYILSIAEATRHGGEFLARRIPPATR